MNSSRNYGTQSTTRDSWPITTYQADKLVLLRPEDGKLNTHFQTFRRPMARSAGGRHHATTSFDDIFDGP